MKSGNEQLKLIRWGIIGCGSVTEIKSGPPYSKVEGFELAAVMRRDEIKVKDFAKRHGVKKYYTNAVDLIEDPEIDAIYIATPPDSHKYYGLKVAAVGKPCCIEKPLAPCYKDSLAIYEAFEKSSVPLFVAYYRRSLPRFKQVKHWIDNGNIGEVRHINWHLSKPANSLDLSGNYNWRTDKLIADGGYFDDLASHGLDLFVFLLGNVKAAHGISLNQQGLYSSKDAISACWLHENGVTGAGSWNFGSNIREDKVEVYGSKGKIEFSIFDEAPLVLNSSIEQQSVFIENPKNIQFYHVKNMRDQLFQNQVHPSTGLSASHTSWIMDKILNRI